MLHLALKPLTWPAAVGVCWVFPPTLSLSLLTLTYRHSFIMERRQLRATTDCLLLATGLCVITRLAKAPKASFNSRPECRCPRGSWTRGGEGVQQRKYLCWPFPPRLVPMTNDDSPVRFCMSGVECWLRCAVGTCTVIQIITRMQPIPGTDWSASVFFLAKKVRSRAF